MTLHLVLIGNVPENVRRGLAVADAFAEGISPGILLGSKESRACSCLLLGFATDEEQRKALDYLKGLQKRKVKKVLNTISGDLDFSQCVVEDYGSQRVVCPPVLEIFASPHFTEPFSYFDVPRPLTLHVWAVAVDVFDDEIARNPVLLQRHFHAFSKMVAIAHFSPAKVGSSSTKATVYILHKYSVDYLKKLAKNLKDYHYFSVVSVKEEEKVLSALCAVQDVCLTNYLQVDGDREILTAPVTVRTKATRRTHMRLIFQIQSQDKWTIGCDMDNIRFSPIPAVARDDRDRRRRYHSKMVSMPGRDVCNFLLTTHRAEAEALLESSNCRFRERRGQFQNNSFAYQLAVVEADTEEEAANGKAALERLAHDILQHRVYKRLVIKPPELNTVMRLAKTKLMQDKEIARIVKPRTRAIADQVPLCFAKLHQFTRGERHEQTLTLQLNKPVYNDQFAMADVDAMVLFSNSTLLLADGMARDVINHGGTGIADDSQAWVESNGDVFTTAPALSSGKLPAPVLIHSNPNCIKGGDMREGQVFKTAFSKQLKLIFQTASDVQAKSIAIPFLPKPGQDYLTAREWFQLIGQGAMECLRSGTSLERILFNYYTRSSRDPIGDLQFALSALMEENVPTARKRIGNVLFSLQTVVDTPAPPVECCPPSASFLLVAESYNDLETGEACLQQTLRDELIIQRHECKGLDARDVVMRWKELLMDLKVHCSLTAEESERGASCLLLRGQRKNVGDAAKLLKVLIADLEGSTSGVSLEHPAAAESCHAATAAAAIP
ncbi:uncharacterized protein LOC135810215 [Sycon ciliatum]|uniref:uncharacterized protein LOC135810215 n=1 Tax=Sycon ciliatum TaxID=27933 RepID=UPI0031F668B6